MTYKHPVEMMLTGYTHEYCTYELDTREVNTLINHFTTLAVKAGKSGEINPCANALAN